MKEKILAALRSKYANYGLSDKALLGIASMLAITITDEANIETEIAKEGVVEALKGVQAEADSRVKTAVAKAKQETKTEDKDEDPDPEKPNTKGGDDDVKTLLKTLVEQNKTLTEEISNIKKEKVGQSLTKRITDALKEKKVDDDYITEQLDGREFDSEESADAFVAKVEAGWGKLKQKFANEKLGEGAESPFVANQEGESDFITNLKAANKTTEAKKD